MKTIITLKTFCTLALTFCLTTVHAQIYVNQAATGANDGTSWADAYTNLDAALTSNSNTAIWIAAGTYSPSDISLDTLNTFNVISATTIYGGFTGTESSIDDRVEGNETILSGDINGDDIDGDLFTNKSDNVFHIMVVNASGPGMTVTLDGLTFKGGTARAASVGSDINWAGAAIYAYSTIEVNNCDFNNNFARRGGAVYVSPELQNSHNSKFDNCSFSDNQSISQGAGIFADGIEGLEVKNTLFKENATVRGAFYPIRCTGLVVDNCTFEDNISSTDNFGGSLFIWSSRGTISNTTFSGSRAGNAGAIYFDGRDDTKGASNMIFSNCTFDNNACSDFGGGAMYAFSSSYTMENCTFSNNIAGNSGGAVFNSGTNMDVIIRGSTFTENSATFGGAHTNYGTNCDYSYEGNTYSGNQAGTSGGAIISGFEAQVTVEDCDFIANIARFGGAMYNQNDTTAVSVSNSMFNENTTGEDNGGAINIGGPVAFSLENCSFRNNNADFGGAINSNGISDNEIGMAQLNINNTLFLENAAATQGAGISMINTNANITNSVVATNFNTGSGAGGGLSLNATDSITMDVNIYNTTIADNFAVIGAGISGFTTEMSSELNISLANNIFSNEGISYEVEAGEPTTTSMGGNISTDVSLEDIFTGPGDISESGDILFTNGANLDFSLQDGSPAINIGVVDFASENDILGLPRNGAPDAGAFEKQPSSTEEIIDNNNQLSMAPNPVRSLTEITIDNIWTGDVEISIYDINGKLISKEIKRKAGKILTTTKDLSELSSGIYLIQARADNKIVTLQFSKL